MPHSHRPPWSRGRALGVAVLLGFGCAVAVALGCAWFADPDREEPRIGLRSSPSRSREIGVFDGFGHCVVWSTIAASASDDIFIVTPNPSKGMLDPDELVPSWAPLDAPTPQFEALLPDARDADEVALERRVLHAAGWPCRAFWCEGYRAVWIGGRAPDVIDTTWFIHTRTPTSSSVIRRLIPLRPVWWGLALDTAFYATILGGAGWGLGIARRARRRRRGRCAACGHVLHGVAVCPECGVRGPHGAPRTS